MPIILALLFFLLPLQLPANAYIGHSKCGGRFGDQVLHYLHAKWLSLHYRVPLYYTPFCHSDELMLDAVEPRLGPPTSLGLTPFLLRLPTQINPRMPLLYECPYFPHTKEEQREGGWHAFPLNWDDPVFRKMALELIAPKHPLALALPPPGKLSIAIHVREGGGFDAEHTRVNDPLKLPPISYYAEALQMVLEEFPSTPLYCHLFTDAADPQPIADALAEVLTRHPNAEFGYRAQDNHHTKHVVEDFFSLYHYDILIRPRSNFSAVPEILHDFALCYYPTEYTRDNKEIRITRISVNRKSTPSLISPHQED